MCNVFPTKLSEQTQFFLQNETCPSSSPMSKQYINILWKIMPIQKVVIDSQYSMIFERGYKAQVYNPIPIKVL